MKHPGSAAANMHGVVLDIESAPSLDLVQAVGAGGRHGFERPALHKIVCASALTFHQCVETGEFSGLSLHTFTSEERPEASILVGVDLLLPDAREATSRLITWNGRHDLRILHARAVALWLAGLGALRGWLDRGSFPRHLDLMRETGSDARGWQRLRDVCAGMGITIQGSGETVTRAIAAGAWDRVACHNRMDVLGTFLVHAGRETFRRGCPVPYATAWREVSKLTRGRRGAFSQEGYLSTHYLVDVAARQLASHNERDCTCRSRLAEPQS